MLSVSYISRDSYLSVFYYCAVLCCVQIIECIITRWSYWFVCTSLYLIIIIMQTYLKVLNLLNDCQVNSVSSVCLRLSQFSQIYFMKYMGLCAFSLLISLMMIVRYVYFILIITIESEVSPIYHCLGIGHETMVYTVCLFIFL